MIEVTGYVEVEGFEFHDTYILNASTKVLDNFNFLDNLEKELSTEEFTEFVVDWYLPMKKICNEIVWSYRED
jgi:hypothetical protein